MRGAVVLVSSRGKISRLQCPFLTGVYIATVKNATKRCDGLGEVIQVLERDYIALIDGQRVGRIGQILHYDDIFFGLIEYKSGALARSWSRGRGRAKSRRRSRGGSRRMARSRCR